MIRETPGWANEGGRCGWTQTALAIPGGEVPGEAKYGDGDWGQVVTYLCDIDPYKRLKSSHEQVCPCVTSRPSAILNWLVATSLRKSRVTLENYQPLCRRPYRKFYS